MSKYNTKKEPVVKRATTHEGGSGYIQSDEETLIGMLATGMSNTFYESEGEREKRFKEVFNKVAKKDYLFAAKSLIYARTVYGQRSISHFGAVEIIPYLQGKELGKIFYSKRDKKAKKKGIIWRLDDMTEILAAYFVKNGENASIPNSIKKGFKDAIEHADSYELAKYQMKGKNVSLVDIVNLVHPKETSRNGNVSVDQETYIKAVKGTKFDGRGIIIAMDNKVSIPSLRALVLGLLKQHNTVEDKNTKTGQVIASAVKSGELTKTQAETVLKEEKADNFADLIKTKKIGYLALLRNLRNIIKTGNTTLLRDASNLIDNQDFIRKSLVWPHQIDLAAEILMAEFSGQSLQIVLKALGNAYEKAIPNLTEAFSAGKTAIVYDTSGSMQGGWGGGVYINKTTRINSSPVEKAALVAATLSKAIGGDVYQFGTRTLPVTGFNPNDSVNTIKKYFTGQIGAAGHGTAYSTILPELQRTGGGYDRIFIITDEQGAGEFESSYKRYSAEYGTPYVYFINLTGYANTMLKAGNKVFRLQGYSSDIYELAKKVEIDPKVVIKEINAIQL
jgi:hypothetical protein